MSNEEQLGLINQGVEIWNAWRREHPEILPDLRGVDLTQAQLRGVNFSNVNFSVLNIDESESKDGHWGWFRTSLMFADLRNADFTDANLDGAFLSLSDLSGAVLANARLSDANLPGVNLSHADLTQVDLSGADLRGVVFTNAQIAGTRFVNTDLSSAEGLETVIHHGPSTIGIDTLYQSDGRIPEVFLRGAGVPEEFITFVPSLVGRAIEFYSCFISYSHQDEEFSRCLHSRMRRENLRVWYAPENIKGGRKLHEEIFRAIQIHDKLLLVLSDNSMKSEWVMTEVRKARKVELEEKRRKLFPIRVVDFDAIRQWECFDADTGKDLAVELREYYIPDFSNWRDHNSFEKEFAKLLRDLKSTDC
jgi:hypothetical protein